MDLLERFVALLPPSLTIDEVRVGLFWLGVRTPVGTGLCANPYTWNEQTPDGLPIRHAGSLRGREARALAAELLDGNAIERALVVATVAASLPDDRLGHPIEESAEPLLERLGKERDVALVGHFHFADSLRQHVGALSVYEMAHRLHPGDLAIEGLASALPRHDLLVFTASMLATGGLGDALASARPDAIKVLVGPSAPLHPLLWSFGFDYVCGTRVVDGPAALRTLSEGAVHKQMEGLQKLNFARPVV